ncbi:MAG TPA: dihydrodipicolinate synthase family protein [bacterium]|nr:dihydrodipicolinate synthase family protein [bacterium]HPP00991.1 dihydrodipicolinate synthase family protein [bacterium]
MMDHREKLSGIFLPVTTPFNEDMSIDLGALQSNMRFYAQTGIKGFLALGSNGENRCLRESEKLTVLQTILETKRPDQIVMTGCIYDSTPLTVEFMRTAQHLGSDYATLLTPSYFRKQMTPPVLVDYFTECAESAGIPVLLYNAPGFTGVTLTRETVSILARHPNIVGIKDSAPTGIEQFIPLDNAGFCVMAGSAAFIYPTMRLGLRGGIASLGNAFPEALLQLWNYGRQGPDGEGQAFHERITEANRRVSGTYGVPGVKCAMDLAGLAGGYPRKPLRRLEGADREAVRQALVETGLLS